MHLGYVISQSFPYSYAYRYFLITVIGTKLLYIMYLHAFLGLLILQVLKETLLRHGFTFESETDTEVIPKLAKFIFDNANEEGKYIVTSS